MLSLFVTEAVLVRGAEKPQIDASRVLVQGNPPLTARLVDQITEFFEWVFEVKLNSKQRTELVLSLMATWQAPDQSGIDAFVNARKLFDNLATESQQRRIEERDRIRAILLESYGDKPPDPLWQMLISAYKDTHPTVMGKPGDVRPGARLTAIPAELVGEWITRRGSGTSYSNAQTGQSGPPNATVASYKIFANGTYEHGMQMQSALYGCSTTIFGRETGIITVATSTFTITPRSGTLDYKSSCSPSMNSNKPTTFPPETMSWRIERGEYGLKLCLQNAKGDSACFDKQ
jgi:hypothetical protein